MTEGEASEVIRQWHQRRKLAHRLWRRPECGESAQRVRKGLVYDASGADHDIENDFLRGFGGLQTVAEYQQDEQRMAETRTQSVHVDGLNNGGDGLAKVEGVREDRGDNGLVDGKGEPAQDMMSEDTDNDPEEIMLPNMKIKEPGGVQGRKALMSEDTAPNKVGIILEKVIVSEVVATATGVEGGGGEPVGVLGGAGGGGGGEAVEEAEEEVVEVGAVEVVEAVEEPEEPAEEEEGEEEGGVGAAARAAALFLAGPAIFFFFGFFFGLLGAGVGLVGAGGVGFCWCWEKKRRKRARDFCSPCQVVYTLTRTAGTLHSSVRLSSNKPQSGIALSLLHPLGKGDFEYSISHATPAAARVAMRHSSTPRKDSRYEFSVSVMSRGFNWKISSCYSAASQHIMKSPLDHNSSIKDEEKEGGIRGDPHGVIEFRNEFGRNPTAPQCREPGLRKPNIMMMKKPSQSEDSAPRSPPLCLAMRRRRIACEVWRFRYLTAGETRRCDAACAERSLRLAEERRAQRDHLAQKRAALRAKEIGVDAHDVGEGRVLLKPLARRTSAIRPAAGFENEVCPTLATRLSIQPD
ncbi:hypothetical protein BU16DRAFT_545375 [Lophium mytilinum]|uniref:Uncharacterized protein n=1 Tax=Lophium mytilinum TaxID=390894 RepID=A0A6A6Q7L1_9PEZI|nr:hypothetical protein BU16DRAFT_545375 [Lophium mytilinum]